MATARPSRTAPRRPRPAAPTGTGGRSAAARAAAVAAAQQRRRANTRLFYDISGIALIAVGLLLLVSLILAPRAGENVFGTAVVQGLRYLVGAGAWVFPFVLLLSGVMLAVGRSRTWDNIGGAVTLFLVFVTWRHLGGPFAHGHEFGRDNLLGYGGVAGAALSWALRAAVGAIGGYIVLAALTVGALLYLTDVPLPSILGPVERLLHSGAKASGQAVATGARTVVDRAREQRDFRQELRDEQRRQGVPEGPRRHHTKQPLDDQAASTPTLFKRGTPEPVDPVSDTATTQPVVSGSRKGKVAPEDEDSPARAAQPGLFSFPKKSPPPHPETSVEKKPTTAASPRGIDKSAPELTDISRFALPPLTLLAAPVPQSTKGSGESESRREVLIQTLEDFGIGADIADVSTGPAFTRYEVALERGIKVSKIVSLADNLAMSLAAIDVRVEAPIPGKSAIGIEVPNETPTSVTLREVIERPEFQNAPSKLTFALGKDVTGTCRYADLAKMPHLLVGGSTGSGKSVALNTLICSLLYRATPRELKFLMIDPKKVELSLYDGIPHLAAPVITNVKQAPSIFKQALKEMETRYDRFAKAGTRNLEGYNSRVSEEERLPYWVLIVDELADLMMTSGPEIEQSICRLAQLSRATGIHLVIATQRPSVNVITGTIKANISSRIAFAVNSAVDSRTILDMTGADRLIGRGDMLFMPIDAAKPQRIQGCFVSEQETEELVAYLKAQAQPNYEVLPSTLSLATGDDDAGEGDPDDDLFEAAVKLVVTNGQASTSMLQRRFKIGYTRAARLVDLMEQRGIVGPLDGAKPRDILMTRDDVDAMFNRTEIGHFGDEG